MSLNKEQTQTRLRGKEVRKNPCDRSGRYKANFLMPSEEINISVQWFKETLNEKLLLLWL